VALLWNWNDLSKTIRNKIWNYCRTKTKSEKICITKISLYDDLWQNLYATTVSTRQSNRVCVNRWLTEHPFGSTVQHVRRGSRWLQLQLCRALQKSLVVLRLPPVSNLNGYYYDSLHSAKVSTSCRRPTCSEHDGKLQPHRATVSYRVWNRA